MTLFATGIGELADVYCCLSAHAGMLVTVALAILAAARGSVWGIVTSFLFAGFMGTVVIFSAVTHELHDTEDSRGVHAMLWGFVWFWAASLCAPIGASCYLLVGGRQPHPAPPGATEAEPPRTDFAPVAFRFRVGWLVALALLALGIALFASFVQ